MITAEKKLSMAKVQLILNHPFFATIALNLKWVMHESVPTMCTDGTTVWFGPKFVEEIPLDHVVGVMCHEIMHIASLHHLRMEARNPEKWNVACDYAINQILENANISLPQGALKNPAYAGMYSEHIYTLLPDSPKKDGNGGGDSIDGSDPGGCGRVIQAPVKSESEAKKLEAEMKQLVAQAANMAKQRGMLPSMLERFVESVMKPVINWREVLARFISEVARNDYSFSRPSTRYMHLGLYLPALYSIEFGEVIMIVDTSGSINGRILNQFASEMSDILSEFRKGFKVIWVDAEVSGVQDIEEVTELQPKGGGGTDFKPGFEWIKKNSESPACIIYFTDGYCNSFPEDPGIPVLWAVYNNESFTAPFGEIVEINEAPHEETV